VVLVDPGDFDESGITTPVDCSECVGRAGASGVSTSSFLSFSRIAIELDGMRIVSIASPPEHGRAQLTEFDFEHSLLRPVDSQCEPFLNRRSREGPRNPACRRGRVGAAGVNTRRRPACAPAPSNACAPVSARASRPSKSLAIKAVRLAPFDFFDCFSKRAHLRRPGGANPLDPSADQGSVDRQDHGGNPAFRGTRVPVHRLAELVPSPEGKCSRRGERLAPAPAE
jgi:hypothetical protein